MIKTNILLLSVIINYETSQFRLNPTGPLHENYSVKCLTDFIDRNFIYIDELGNKVHYSLAMITIISSTNLTSPGFEIQRKLIQELHVRSKWSLEIVTKYQIKFASHSEKTRKVFILQVKTSFYIIIIDQWNTIIEKFIILRKLQSYNERAIFLIYFTFYVSRDEVRAVFDEFSRHMLFKVLIVIPKTRKRFHIVTFDFRRIAGQNCIDFPNHYRVANCFKDNYEEIVNFLKFIDQPFNNCTVSVVASRIEPYVITKKHGIEVELLRNTFTDLLNITFEFEIEDDEFYGEKTNDNRTWSNSLGIIYNEFHIGIGNIAPSSYYLDDFEFGRRYYQEDLVWVVPIANYIPKWRVLIAIFSWKVWTLCIALIIFCSILFRYLSIDSDPYKSLRNSFFISLQLLAGLSTAFQPKTAVTKLIYIFLAVFSIEIVALYTMSLIDYLKFPRRESQIDTTYDIATSGLKVRSLPLNRDLFNSSSDPIYIKINRSYEAIFDIYDEIILVSQFRNSCTIHSKLSVNYLLSTEDDQLIDEYGKPKLFIIQRPLFSYSISMMLRRGYPYLDKFNSVINKLSNGELIGLFAKKYLDISHKVESMNVDDSAFHPLNLDNIQGAFVLLIFGYLIGIVMLILENIKCIILKRRAKNQKRTKILNVKNKTKKTV